MKIRRFEDIPAWQEARILTKAIYTISAGGQWAKDYALRDQIRRASISVMSNIAEGFERRADNDYARFLAMAKASASEVKSQLYIALDQGYIDEIRFRELYERCQKVARFLGSFTRSLKKRTRDA
ncbi:MAG: four helix bundle protein [Pirellulaceae bacterium]|nr:MAG: four helix bundle protein [Pirellulaceae bacterium]